MKKISGRLDDLLFKFKCFHQERKREEELIEVQKEMVIRNNHCIKLSDIKKGDMVYNVHGDVSSIINTKRTCFNSKVYMIEFENDLNIMLSEQQKLFVKDDNKERVMTVKEAFKLFMENEDLKIPLPEPIIYLTDKNEEQPYDRVMEYIKDLDDHFTLKHPWICGFVLRTNVYDEGSGLDDIVYFDFSDSSNKSINELSAALNATLMYDENKQLSYFKSREDGDVIKYNFLADYIFISNIISKSYIEIIEVYNYGIHIDRYMLLFGLIGLSTSMLEEILLHDPIKSFQLSVHIPDNLIENYSNLYSELKFLAYSLGCRILIEGNYVTIEYQSSDRDIHITNIKETNYYTNDFRIKTDNPDKGYLSNNFILLHE